MFQEFHVDVVRQIQGRRLEVFAFHPSLCILAVELTDRALLVVIAILYCTSKYNTLNPRNFTDETIR